jgi:17beta-estradiol 17-dehydrogenase / very-long-chain 3-oxoacyl-CoA reductase
LQLAEKGLNIILVSRTLEKLKSVAIQIEKTYKVQTKIIAVDFTKVVGIYEKIEEQIEGLEIGVLVNNVGMCLEEPEYFLRMPNSKEFCDQIIHCNVTSVVQMTRLILPQMVERQKGLIINISSMTSLVPTPLIIVYGSTKSFVTKFSDDLRLEYKQHGITIQTMCPFFVSTNMIKSKTTSWDVPSPRTFVKSALRSVGISEKTTGYYIHALQCIYLKVYNYLLPSLYRRAIINTMENIIEIREKEN